MSAILTENGLQDADENCESCRLFWEHQGLPPMVMVYVRDNGGVMTTENYDIPIVVCPHCDGDAILRLPKE